MTAKSKGIVRRQFAADYKCKPAEIDVRSASEPSPADEEWQRSTAANVARILECAGETPQDAQRMAERGVAAMRADSVMACHGCVTGRLLSFDHKGLPMARCDNCGMEVNDPNPIRKG
jgi:hypothetical protein